MDAVKCIVEEGLDARNIVSWRVPNEPSPVTTDRIKSSPKSESDTKHKHRKRPSPQQSDSESSRNDNNPNFQNKLWNFLFTNINRAVDELYNLCEDENNEARCVEGIELFERCKRDFEKLIERMADQRRFEQDHQRGVSWEVRKTSLGGRRQQVESALQASEGDSYSGTSRRPQASQGPVSTNTLTSASSSKLSATAAPFCPQSICKPSQSPVPVLSLPTATQSHSLSNNSDDTPSKFDAFPDSASSDRSVSSMKSSQSNHGVADSVVEHPPAESQSDVFESVSAPCNSTDTEAKTLSNDDGNAHVRDLNSSPVSAWSRPISISHIVTPPPQKGHEKRTLQPLKNIPATEVSSDRRQNILLTTTNTHDEDADMELLRESEKVWAETEAWVEAELRAEEEAWSAMDRQSSTSSSDGGSPFGRAGVHRSIFGLEVEVDDGPPSCSTGQLPGDKMSKFSPRIQGGSDESSLYEDGCDDPLPSPGSGSIRSNPPSAHRRLHEKLSSPDRYKCRLTPEEARQRQEARQSVAESNRDKTVMEIKQKAMVASSRVKASEHREAQRIAQADQTYTEKLREAERRHSEHIKSVRGKAGNENTKVSEVLFINSLNESALADELQRSLAEAEARIMAGRQRREELLKGITIQQRKRNNKKVEQMSELRLALEKQKMERWEKIQHRLETVRQRREERIAEMLRRKEAKESVDTTSAEDISHLVGNDELLATTDVKNEMNVVAPVSRKAKSKTKHRTCQSPELDEHALLDKVIRENNTTTMGDSSSASGEYLCSAMTKFQLLVNGPETVDVRDNARGSLNAESMKNGNVDVCKDFRSVNDRIESILAGGMTPYLVLSRERAMSEDTSYSQQSTASASSKRSRRRKKILQKQDIRENSSPTAVSESGHSDAVDVVAALRQFPTIDSLCINEFISCGGLLLCNHVLDKDFGCLSSPAKFREAVAHTGNNESTIQIFCKALRTCARVPEKGSKIAINGKELFESGASVGAADLAHYLLLCVQSWGSQHFPRGQYQKPKSTANGASASKSGKKKKKSSTPRSHDSEMGTPVRSYYSPSGSYTTPIRGIAIASAADERVLAPLKWPDQLSTLLCPLLVVLTRLCQFCSDYIAQCSRGECSDTSVKWYQQALAWVRYVSSSGLLDSVGSTLRDLQGASRHCESDRFVFELICDLAAFVSEYTAVSRVHSREGHSPSDVIETMSELSISGVVESEVKELCMVVRSAVEESELSLHLVALLGTLLLQDGAHRRRGDGTPGHSGTVNTFVPDPPSVIITCHEILRALNQLCRFDIRTAQSLPQDLQALVVHVAEKLLNSLIRSMDQIVSGLPVAHNFAAKSLKKRKKNTAVSSLPQMSIPPLTMDNLERSLEQLLVYLGYLCLDCSANQAFMSTGTPPSLLVQLCNLPIRYISSERLKYQLAPTLICMCYKNELNLREMCRELNPLLLVDIMKAACKAHDTYNHGIVMGKKVQVSECTPSEQYMIGFSSRFPVEYWQDALSFFNLHSSKI